MMRLLLLSWAMLICIITQAQIITTYPKDNPQLKEYTLQQGKNQPAVERGNQMLDLPFFDDFSYNGPYPVSSHWENRDVFVNNAWANEPVSVGVATFDGLDASGSPYGGKFASSDTLTSVPLNLGGLSKAYISYYVQAKGLGDVPEPGSDLVLEFKTPTGDWVEMERHVQSIAFFPRDSVTEFSFIGPIVIDETQFLYSGFQFRFRNYSLRNGAVDLWHLDYVRVDKEPTEQIIEDLAFTKLPPSIFETYTSAPWSHYIDPQSDLSNVETRKDFKAELYNHADKNITIQTGELGTFNVTTGDENELFALDDLFASPSISPKRQSVDYNISFNFSTLIEPLKDVPFIRDNSIVQIKTQYEMDPSPQAEEVAEITRNDVVSSVTELRNYYAYDDGSAESAIEIRGLGGGGAMEFYNYRADSLRGFQIQIPRLAAGAASGTITLKVWAEDLILPPIAELKIAPFFIDEFSDTLQAFITYALKDQITGEPTPIALPVGTFYVGWEQGLCQTNCVPVGLDRNTPEAAERVFLNADGNWRRVSENEDLYGHLKGALMLRPILGNTTPRDSELATSAKQLVVKEHMQIFPNPASDQVYIQLYDNNYSDYQLQIHNAMGQLLVQQPLSPQLDISQYPTGIYFLQLQHIATKAVGYQKLVVE